MWLAVGAAGLCLVMAATALAAPGRAAAFLGRPQPGIAAALAREARAVLERAHEPGSIPESHVHTRELHRAFAEVVVALALSERNEEAGQMLREAAEHGVPRGAVAARLAAALVLAGRVREGERVLGESSDWLSADALIEVARWLVMDGRTADAAKVSRALLAGERLDQAFASIAGALAEKSLIAEARHFASIINTPAQKSVAFAAMASASAGKGQGSHAETFIAMALEQARLADDPVVTHIALVPALASVRGAQQAIESAGRIPDTRVRDEALFAAFTKLMERGRGADADAVERHARELIETPFEGSQVAQLNRIRSRSALRQALRATKSAIPNESTIDEGPGCHDSGPVSYSHFVDAIVRTGDIAGVKTMANRLPNGSYRGWMLALTAAALWRTGQADEAERLADAAWRAYQDGPGISELAEEAILWIMAENGMTRKAGEITRAAKREDLSVIFARELRRQGRLRDAYDFEHYAGLHEKPATSEPGIYRLVRAGRLEEVVRYARQFDDSPMKVKVLARAAIRYMRAVPIHTPD